MGTIKRIPNKSKDWKTLKPSFQLRVSDVCQVTEKIIISYEKNG